MTDLIFDSEYISVALEREQSIVHITRTAHPFKDAPSILKTLDEMMTEVRREEVGGFGLLVDATVAPAPTSARYEETFKMFANYVNSHFARVSVVVSTTEMALAMNESAPFENVTFFDSPEAARSALQGKT